ncbi:hypothetical protein [Moorena sp. SIO3I6]|uniref:hypothetical protein n=1 Tax=Moorena sp. SIO3I6 TaxID=2607831 RepID=UPI0013F77719|nr:hypothetical protein [Moorena sp. SIO3I6]NEP22346.1 hypothetical protein [Moorena sp. SIO3I6]
MRNYDPSIPLFSIHIPKAGGQSFSDVLASWFNNNRFPNLNNHPKLSKILTPLNADLFLQRFLGCGLYFHYKDHVLNKPPRKIPLGKGYGSLLSRKIPECIHGHFESYGDGKSLFEYYPKARQFVTVLRDPLQLQISLYFYHKRLLNNGVIYWNGHKNNSLAFPCLEDWVKNRGAYMLNLFPWKITKDNFIEILKSNFVHLCVVENYQTSIDILADKLGCPTVKVPVINKSPRDEGDLLSDSTINFFKEKHELEYLIYNYALSINQF